MASRTTTKNKKSKNLKYKKKKIKKQNATKTQKLKIKGSPILKNEAVFLAAGLVIGVLIMFAYSQTQLNTKDENKNTGFLTQQEAAKIVLDIIKMDPNLNNMYNVSLVNATETNNLYKIVIEISSQGNKRLFNSYITKDGKLLFPTGIDVEQYKALIKQIKNQGNSLQGETTPPNNKITGNFIATNDDECFEENKPIVYFFGSNSCPHCRWEHPVVEAVAEEFKDYISFHNNMDSQEDMDIFSKYSTGGIPTIIIGCKYYRVGSGENFGEEQEKQNLRNLICELTNNQPANICSS